MTAASKRHMDRVSQLPCCLCNAQPVELHHLREGQGMSQRASDMLVIPVCPSCHRGPQGIHGDKSMLRIYKKTELDLLADTLEALA
jgi:hypothetical protein